MLFETHHAPYLQTSLFFLRREDALLLYTFSLTPPSPPFHPSTLIIVTPPSKNIVFISHCYVF